ncbi:MAG: tetratricopeptide repeat-containing sensor histidine kinase [Bacteroidota bacterium]
MKQAYAFLIIFNLLGITVRANGHHPEIDSLKKLVKPAVNSPDTLHVNRLNTLAEDYFESQPDSTTYYANLAIGLSNKLGYKKGLADAYIQIASVNSFRGNYAVSTANFNRALLLYQQIIDPLGISESLIGLGRVQDLLGNYNNAIRFFNQALAIRKKSGKEMDIADCYGTMGITYDNMGEFSKALDCYFKSLIIDIRHKEELAAADNYCNIGVIMQHLQLYPKALAYFNKAYKIWAVLNDKQGISTINQNIGEVLMAQKNYSKAINYLHKASAVFHHMDDKEGISLIYYDLGLYNYYTQRPDSALHYLHLALQSAGQYKIKYNKAYAYLGLAMVYNQERDYANAYTYALLAQNTANNLGSLNIRADATLQVSRALAGLKRFEEAYQQHQLHNALRDSLKNNENIQKLTSYNLEIDFEKRQKEATLTYQQKIATQKNTNIIGTIVIVVMAIIIGLYYNAKRKQQKINKLLADKNTEILRQKADLDLQASKLTDLNALKDRLIAVLAHDLRAPLSTLRGLFALMADESISHEEFASMIPQVFNKLEHTSDFLDTLLSWINSQVDDAAHTALSFFIGDIVTQELSYLDEQLKNKQITIQADIANDALIVAEPNSVRIVIHNILTNAIKFSHRNGAIHLLARRENSEVIFTVRDTGTGLSEDQQAKLFKIRVTSMSGTENETGTGMGLLFCKDLIEKYKGRIWAQNIVGTGTEVGFSLPAAIL